MKNVLIFGASITHGVGGAQGGWTDLLKRAMHQQLYSPGTSDAGGDMYELGIPGQTAAQLLERFESELRCRVGMRGPSNNVVVLSVGTNDSKAVDHPDNFISTPEAFASTFKQLLAIAQSHAKDVAVVGLTPVDEAKTTPKHNPLNDQTSFFTNARLKVFNDTLHLVCTDHKVTMISLFDTVPADWSSSRLFADGLHPNALGYAWMYEQIKPHIWKLAGL